MTRISLSSVRVEFFVYNAAARSLKNRIVHAATGGRVERNGRGAVLVTAIEDVTLNLREGDRLAIVGHNDAGKSTLLRVMAGIYELTQGCMEVSGRVVPIFDVGLGFDPESTGYEYIKLRGLHLGMSAREVAGRAAGIAEVCGLGEFLNMPLRTYSSGMQARLAFAVSTCVEPDILLLDEGIAAGDAAFIEAANARMEAFLSRAGILVLASHDENLLRRTCNRAILMQHGRLVAQGGVSEVLDIYRQGP